MIWETQALVTDDSAFGRMTSALTFIKLTQRTDCVMNWSRKPASAPGGEALRWTLAKAPSSWASAVEQRGQPRSEEHGVLSAGRCPGAERGGARQALGLDPQVHQACPLLPHEASCGREEMFHC